jgi:hypothetical protein
MTNESNDLTGRFCNTVKIINYGPFSGKLLTNDKFIEKAFLKME